MASEQNRELALRLVYGAALFLACCAAGTGVMALVDLGQAQTPSWGKGLAASLAPSLIAGALFVWHLSRSRRSEVQHDPLTGFPDSARLIETLPAELHRAKRLGKHVALVIADLEQSDRLGVPEYIAWRAMARTLRRSLRLTDGCFVLDAGRFAILLNATNPEGGQVVIERLRKAVQDVPELYGVKVRLGQELFDPAKAEAEPPGRLLEQALAAARAAMVETTVPRMPVSAVVNG